MSAEEKITTEEAARILLRAADERRACPPLTDRWPGLDLAQAYAIQDECLRARLKRGERLAGVKLGLTSRAKQQQMGVDRPIVAWLTESMALPDGGAAPRDRLIHPRVEPEIVFILGERLAGPGVTAAMVRGAVASVRIGLEVIDSRYQNFRFTLADVVADNASSAFFVLGPAQTSAPATDLPAEEFVLKMDGETVASATGAAVLGDPAEAAAFAANVLAERGLGLEPGWIILTGGLTEAIALKPGSTIIAESANLGAVSVNGGFA